MNFAFGGIKIVSKNYLCIIKIIKYVITGNTYFINS